MNMAVTTVQAWARVAPSASSHSSSPRDACLVGSHDIPFVDQVTCAGSERADAQGKIHAVVGKNLDAACSLAQTAPTAV